MATVPSLRLIPVLGVRMAGSSSSTRSESAGLIGTSAWGTGVVEMPLDFSQKLVSGQMLLDHPPLRVEKEVFRNPNHT